MKAIILIVSLLISSLAVAAPAVINLPPFKGQLLPGNKTITKVSVSAVIKYNNCFMGFCTYDSMKEQREELLTEVSKKSVKIELGHEISNMADNYRMFHTCTVALNIDAQGSNGKEYFATIELLEVDNKKTCESADEIGKLIAKKLSQPITPTFY